MYILTPFVANEPRSRIFVARFIVLVAVLLNVCAILVFGFLRVLQYQVESSHVQDDPVIDMEKYCSDPVNISAPASRVLIVMQDSRSPCQRPVDYHQLSAKINARYAMRHQYGFLYMQTPCPVPANNHSSFDSKACTACLHPVHGPRASPWCKLLAIKYAMASFPRVEYIVFMDSDAVFYTQSLPLEWVFDPFLQQKHQPVLTMFKNDPWPLFTSRGNELGCSGIMFWRNNARALLFLEEWWDFKCPFIWNTIHPYEQQSLHELIEAREYDLDDSLVRVLDIAAFPSTENTKSAQFILHMNPHNWKRFLGWDHGVILGWRPRLYRLWEIWLQLQISERYLHSCVGNCGSN